MLAILNTATGGLDTLEFIPGVPVQVFTCGPTAFGRAHIGMAKSYISFDILVRYLRFLGHKVNYCQNVIDIGQRHRDVPEQHSLLWGDYAHGIGAAVENSIRSFSHECQLLRIEPPDRSLRASHYIPEMIETVVRLLASGHAYEACGSVYFSIEHSPQYGSLSHQKLALLKATGRIPERMEKRSPLDFAVWKKASQNVAMAWASPWGRGVPAWHLECAVLSVLGCGERIDIHGGGIDSLFPHHECKCAILTALLGHPVVRCWMHNNLVSVDGRKMSRQLNSVVWLRDALAMAPPLSLRYLILQNHYRRPLNYRTEAHKSAAAGLRGLHRAVAILRSWSRSIGVSPFDCDPSCSPLLSSFMSAMDRDLNTAEALGVMSDACRRIRHMGTGGSPLCDDLRDLECLFYYGGCSVLGIIPAAMWQEAARLRVKP